MTDTTSHMTPEQEHAFYADPVNQEPQGPGVRRRSKLSSPMPVRFPEDVLQQVRDRAAQDDRSVSQWIRRAVERELSRSDRMATRIDDDPLISPPRETWGLRVWRAANGETVAIVTDVPSGRSLMNASEKVHQQVQARFPGAVVVERWADQTPPFGPYRRSDGAGGSAPIPREQWEVWGITPP